LPRQGVFTKKDKKNMKTTGKLMGAILDLGREMMITGAEVWRVEDLMERLFDAYCFKSWDVWVISS
jgi:uncharacterized membrane protein YjjP (DUF1212 family)